MHTLAIDIETFSSGDLLKGGVYKYVDAPDFTILLFAYSIDGGKVEIVDFASGEMIPAHIEYALEDKAILKTAYNAQFERVCLAKYFRADLLADNWECTMVKAAMLGYPFGLDKVAHVMKLEQQKDNTGKQLIRYFSLPCKPTKVNENRTRNLPSHAPDKWQQFMGYCVQDVVVEQSIREKISWFNIPETEKKLWALDQKINDTGVLLDKSFASNAISINNEYVHELTNEAVNLTNLANPNSASQLKTWLSEALDTEVTSLTKKAVPALLEISNDEDVTRVLEIRQEMSKTSVKKYAAMLSCICEDSRVRGLLQFYGANRTGRWAGRLVQVQNLPQNRISDLELARSIVAKNDLELLEMLYGNVPDTLSQLIRTAFIAGNGKRFIVADLSAIEARVIAWLAGERWRLEVFNTHAHGKIYEASASQMFKVPIENIKKGSDLRQKGKVSELALGYQGGPNALIQMGALEMGIPEEELPKLVKMWRNANKKIVEYWNIVNNAAIDAIDGENNSIKHGIKFSYSKGALIITLPSGRSLYYQNAKLVEGKFGGKAIVYEGMNQATKKWERIDTYGGKLVENIVQAIARDCLADIMLRLNDAGYKIVMSIHDEVVLECPDGFGSCEEVNNIMGTDIIWAKGLPLKADSYEIAFYKKD